MKHTEIIAFIEKTAPLFMAAPWDKSGLQVAALKDDYCHVGVMLDPTLAQVTLALDSGVDFLLTHHPLAMQPRFLDTADSYLQTVAALLTKKACLYSAHTSLDANPLGPVRWLAEKFQLHSLEIIEIMGKNTNGDSFGFGFVGELPVSMTYEEFTSRLSAHLTKQAWAVCGCKPKQVKRVACCPGSGSSVATQAIELGADVLITGDVKFHAALEAPLRILDVGHFILEEVMMQRFASQLASELPISVTFFPSEDPISMEI